MTLNFSMNFEPSFLVGLELVSTRSYAMSVQMTHVYLPLSSSPGMTISYFCHDAKRGWGGGGGQRLNVKMTQIFKKKFGSVPLNRKRTNTEPLEKKPEKCQAIV